MSIKVMHAKTSEASCQVSGGVLNILLDWTVDNFSTSKRRSACRLVSRLV